jgi:hypothetical protein
MKIAPFRKINRLPISMLLLIISSSPGLAGENAGGETYPALSPSNTMKYDATYAGYKFAEIDFSESKPYEFQGDTVRNLECSVRSSGILTIDGSYRSVVRNDYTVLYFKSDEGSPEDRKIAEYWFDYDSSKIDLIRSRIKGADTTRSNAEYTDVDRRYFDSISLVFRIRDGFDTLTTPVYLPVFLESGVDSILIEEISPAEEDTVNGKAHPITKIKGRIPFETYPGFGDEFEIYLTSDDSRIPVRARIEMVLGYIEIKLREPYGDQDTR